MEIRIQKLTIENFKGIKSFEACFDGDDVVIKAENGVGKTSIYDAFLWLLFDKDSTGRKAFEVRPLNRNNEAIKGLVVSVEASIKFGNCVHHLHKEQHEKIVKGQLRGYEAQCWIDEVPKKIGEYQKWINEQIPEDTFKVLTDLNFFNDKIHWTDRRKLLLDIAGEVSTPEGFDSLLTELNGRTIDEFKAVLLEQKKRHTKERDEINPRLDEILKNLDEPDADVSDLTKQRDALQTEIDKLETLRRELTSQEAARQKTLEAINALKTKRIEREGELKNDTSAVQALIEERAGLDKPVIDQYQKVSDAKEAVRQNESHLTDKQDGFIRLQREIAEIRERYQKTSERPAEKVCYACGQNLPEDKLKEIETKRQTELAGITAEGNVKHEKVKALKAEIEKGEAELRGLKEAVQKEQAALGEADEKRKAERARLDEAIKNRPALDPKQDEQWQKITTDITELETQAGPPFPVSEQLNALDTKRTELEGPRNKLNEQLAQSDRFEKDKKRVQELEARNKELAQLIADIESQLHDIQNYKAEQSKLIETSVNKLFKYVRFKLFEQQLNGEYIDCCEATFNGVPYKDLSTGQQILCGIDIVNVLSGHYGLTVPLYIDHAESVTFPLEANGQTIQLYACPGIKQLKIEKTKQEQKAVA